MVQVISPLEFAKRFRYRVIAHSQPVTWFFGAGCSISSGIPGAGALVTRWLNELHEMQAISVSPEEWAKAEFGDYDPSNPARHYARVFARRHPAQAERQREIEKICAGRDPAYGYATFAQIVSHPQAGPQSNIVLTTNFDDLIADALYLYGDRNKRPQIITHEALARYMGTRSPRPMVVKLHGDAMFDPRNLDHETSKIDDGLTASLYPVLQDSALVFVGYGGNDTSVCGFLNAFARRGLTRPVFWVGRSDPCTAMSKWLKDNGVLRVDHQDFDILMHLIRGELAIDLLSQKQWLQGYVRYVDEFRRIEKEVRREPAGEAKDALQRASRAAEDSLQDDWGYYLKADALEASDPDQADALYREGLQAHPNSAVLNGMYALFLDQMRKDLDGAEAHYKRALEAAPNDANNLGNYAVFLQNVRQDMDGAEAHYKQALEAAPNHAGHLGNYAQLLFAQGRTDEGAALVERALTSSDPAKEAALLVELNTYRLGHLPRQASEAIATLKNLIGAGARTKGWDFSSNIVRAPTDRCVHLDLLKDVVEVVAKGADPAILDKHEAWRNA